MTEMTIKDKISQDKKTSVAQQLQGKFESLLKISTGLLALDKPTQTARFMIEEPENDPEAIERAKNIKQCNIIKSFIHELTVIIDETSEQLDNASYREVFNITASREDNIFDFVAFAQHGEAINNALKFSIEIEEDLTKRQAKHIEESAKHSSEYQQINSTPAKKKIKRTSILGNRTSFKGGMM